MSAIYVYDTRTMMKEPLVVVYDREHLPIVLKALSGEERPDWAYATHVRQHNVGPADPYNTGATYPRTAERRLWPPQKVT